MNTLVLEGKKYDIRVNSLAPAAATRMTEDLMPQQLLDLLAPESVTAGLLFLVSDKAPTGAILTAGAGTFARSRIFETSGDNFLPAEPTPEAVAEHWDAISATEDQTAYATGFDQLRSFVAKAAKNLGIDLSKMQTP